MLQISVTFGEKLKIVQKQKNTKMTKLPLMKLGSLLKKIDEREKGLGVGVEVRGVEKISSSL